MGWSDRWEPHLAEYEFGEAGRVLRHDGTAVLVATEKGSAHIALARSTPQIAVGDWLVVDGEAIVDILPRASLLQRRDPSTGDSQPIAANVDLVGIVCGLDRPVSLGRIQRFTSLAWDAGATPIVILTKADLVEGTVESEEAIRHYDPAAEIFSVSSTTMVGIANLLDRCVGQTLVLVGESGAGKSRLLNALAGRELGDTGSVRQGDHKGRHTTTARQLHSLTGNCCLIDTPGVREVGIHTDIATIDSGFADIADFAQGCRFNDCGHGSEPGCEVQSALVDGRLSLERFESWSQLRREAAWAELRADPAANHRANRQLGRLYREAKRSKRP
ncbi:MAG: ribosome small subunit-dependent GTPase A [Acidimicrobiales bacterium]|nr:ribosome small subunit-dependent GTPase A [Acidimicrobiales bacterium]